MQTSNWRDKTEEEMLNLTEEWHNGDSKLPLHEYLGIPWDEYDEFLKPESRGKRAELEFVDEVCDLPKYVIKEILEVNVIDSKTGEVVLKLDPLKFWDGKDISSETVVAQQVKHDKK